MVDHSLKKSRMRRAKKTRARISEQAVIRLTVHRTPRHIYAQVISSDGSNVLVAASSVEKSIRTLSTYTGNVEAAEAVGTAIAERALAAGINKVAFDRSGFKYHGRVKAVADAARNAGLVI